MSEDKSPEQIKKEAAAAAKAAALAKRKEREQATDVAVPEEDKAKKKAEAAAAAKAAALAKRKEREQATDAAVPEEDKAKKKAEAAAAAKAAALAKWKEREQASDAAVPEEDKAKKKAEAAAAAKAAALAKRQEKEAADNSGDGEEAIKQKALAAAKAKAAAAAKAKAAALAKQTRSETAGNDAEKTKAIAAAKAKAEVAAKAKLKAKEHTSSETAPETEKPSRNLPLLKEYVSTIESQLGEHALEDSYINQLSKEVPTLIAARHTYFQVAELLKNHESMCFDYLSELHGTDYETHMEIYVHLYSFKYKRSVALKVKLDRENPAADSLVPLWQGANWPECEAYDLLGITFNQHPDLKRILLGEDWVGHPLRKDYEPFDVEV
ncbi:NADH dehydrogenase subunit C [Bacillus sp. OV322]|uniref:NADH-quinone oxidoreductase subunit C n=1 Tax=Bacillus sp. OV322 TaxID=1882764 RepID=UPI0008F12033|nr:NADH-quinone oxidoreductase subunit C [Bacillus sp. OV322]SFC21981.1 NADH dehydrogenase subunit C [Bacillus sp. OV322]